MNKITPTSNYVFTFPKDDKGVELKFRFMLSLSKPLGYAFNGVKDDTVVSRLISALGSLDGVDALDPRIGRYTVEVGIARTFDPELVIEEIKRRLDADVLSEIVIATPAQAHKLTLVKD